MTSIFRAPSASTGTRSTKELMIEAGPPEWRVRYLPVDAGLHRIRILARDRNGTAASSLRGLS